MEENASEIHFDGRFASKPWKNRDDELSLSIDIFRGFYVKFVECDPNVDYIRRVSKTDLKLMRRSC